jgi:hypothetical protein
MAGWVHNEKFSARTFSNKSAFICANLFPCPDKAVPLDLSSFFLGGLCGKVLSLIFNSKVFLRAASVSPCLSGEIVLLLLS